MKIVKVTWIDSTASKMSIPKGCIKDIKELEEL